jgi:hypothetical protein
VAKADKIPPGSVKYRDQKTGKVETVKLESLFPADRFGDIDGKCSADGFGIVTDKCEKQREEAKRKEKK